ncbi:TlpA family protein disulfide reductase, partial [Candidatus Bipolaricaulota bacterium]|nr:TlpA family protein disulfide reductase [Candidatus Bipolaricaulota bacterium]
DLRGKVVLLNFWASWCRPCIAKLPLIQQLYEQYAAGGLVIIGINLDRSERMMERILEDFNITFRQIFAQAKEIADLYGVVGIPETFLIDRQGVVRFLSLRHEDSLRAAIARLLAEQ